MIKVQYIRIALALTTVGCAKHGSSKPLAGEYPRSSVQLKQDAHVVPAPTEGDLAAALPLTMKVDNQNGFEVETSEATVSGSYRLIGDSIFFDHHARGLIRVAFAGRVLGDTIDVHWLPAHGDERMPPGADVELRFVRNKAARQGRFPH